MPEFQRLSAAVLQYVVYEESSLVYRPEVRDFYNLHYVMLRTQCII